MRCPSTLLITFDKLPCFVPSFEPTNTFPILIERNREVIEDEMVEEIEENDEDYGNMGFKERDRTLARFFTKINTLTRYYILYFVDRQ